MHWGWKNCPKALAGQFKGKEKGPTVVLKAVSTHSTWIWHPFFGTSGSLNDINILDRSPLFQSMLAGTCWNVEFEVNEHHYNHGYHLADGIYPDWGTLIKSKGLLSSNRATKHFATNQEAMRKDIEQSFALLQGQFQILAQPALQWYPGNLTQIMNTCIILHNMLVEYRTPPKELPPFHLPSGSFHLDWSLSAFVRNVFVQLKWSLLQYTIS